MSGSSLRSDRRSDEDVDSPHSATAAAAAAAHSTDEMSDEEDRSSHNSSSRYKHLRVRYSALRRAFRRQEAELDLLRAVQGQSHAEAQRTAEERRKEQRAMQQLMGQLAQLQEEHEAVRRREERWREREQQLLAEQRSVESQYGGCREESQRLQAELDRQYETVAAERRRLVATVSRHVQEESAQQRTIQSFAVAVDEMRAEMAGREVEREQLLHDAQTLRDAMQLLQAHVQQQAPLASTAAINDIATAAAARQPNQLFLSPLYVASPFLNSTPSTSTCAALRFSSSASLPSSAPPVSSPLATQLLFAATPSSPQPNTGNSQGNDQLTAHAAAPLATSQPSLASSLRSSSHTASSVSPVSPFSVNDFPPLPSSPSAARPSPRSVWGTTERAAHKRGNNRAPLREASADTLSAPSHRASGAQRTAKQSIISRSLHFSTTDEDGMPTSQKLSAAAAAAGEPAHVCSAACSSCHQTAPPAALILPLSFDSPAGNRTDSNSRREQRIASPVRAASAAAAAAASTALQSSSPCSTCQLRACSALLTPVSSSQRSLAVLDSEFRRVKRWTAQLQHHIAQQQQQLQQPDMSLAELRTPRSPATADTRSLQSPHSTVSRRRSSSEPHYAPSDALHPTGAHSHATPSTRVTELRPAAHVLPHSPQPTDIATSTPLSPGRPSMAVSVSSLLVQLSLCESQLAAKESSLQAATQHIAALHDKLAVMADSVEQMEAGIDELHQQAQQQRRQTAEERDRESRALSDRVRAAEDKVAEWAEQCRSVQAELDGTRSEVASQQSQAEQQRSDWEQRCNELVGAMSLLRAQAQMQSEMHDRLRAELETANAALAQHKRADVMHDEKRSEEEDTRRQVAMTGDSAAASAPLLQLVEQQLWEELTELQQLLLHFQPN